MKNGISAVRRAACSIALLSASFCVLSQTSNENSGARLPDVIVSATRIAQPLAQAIADVTVIDRAEIERSGAAALGDVLARLAGFEINRNGGPASTTGVFLRGAETRFTAVHVDGVRALAADETLRAERRSPSETEKLFTRFGLEKRMKAMGLWAFGP